MQKLGLIDAFRKSGARKSWDCVYKKSRLDHKRHNSHNVVHNQKPFRMAVIGSGPAGFYSAYKVMTRIENAVVDMYEQLPTPFGLVRFGVAPDHPEVKNCQDKFSEVASSPRFNFIGNVDVGKDIPLSSLKPHYDAVLFAYGASKDRQLGIPGEENLKGIYSARAFVGWYNGLPEYSDLAPDLSTGEEAVVIGQGNVALDVTRILLSEVERLRSTDISDKALAALSESRVKRVRVIGRRGPMQASFTIKEVRELMTLPGVGFEPIDESLLPIEPTKLPRAQKRLTQLLSKGSSTSMAKAKKSWSLDFLLSPTSFTSFGDAPSQLSSVICAKNTLQGTSLSDPMAKVSMTDDRITIPASLAFRSIGYKSQVIPGMQENGIPFDDRSGTIPNDLYGRIVKSSSDPSDLMARHIPGMYCAGWVKRGPTGVIATTMEDAFATAEAIAYDWEHKVPFLDSKDGSHIEKRGWTALKETIEAKGIRRVSWSDWQKIDTAEKERGARKGKEREKFTSVKEMLEVLD